VERVVDGGDRVGREDGATVGEKDEQRSDQNQVHGDNNLHDGDVSLGDRGKEQFSNLLLLTGGILEEQNGKCDQQVRVGENSVEKGSVQSGSQAKSCGWSRVLRG
jgi:hypothetical protein